jgi:hypothetical protein
MMTGSYIYTLIFISIKIRPNKLKKNINMCPFRAPVPLVHIAWVTKASPSPSKSNNIHQATTSCLRNPLEDLTEKGNEGVKLL